MNLFKTIMETFEEKKDIDEGQEEEKQEEEKQQEKKQDYIPHIFLIIVLLVCIILGIIYMDKIMDVWRRLTSHGQLFDTDGQPFTQTSNNQ
tara:strand:- start:373 stop:645 length:273 start_codon:yes stop_codon:yes gene_type:complete